MTIALVSGQQNNNQNLSGNTVDLTFASPPGLGNLVATFIVGDQNTSSFTILDNNSNTYSITPQGIIGDGFGPAVAKAAVLYLPNAPANASQILHATAVGSAVVLIGGAEFSGVATSSPISVEAFSNSTTQQTNINAPSVTPPDAGSLLFGGIDSLGGLLTTVNSPWVTDLTIISNAVVTVHTIQTTAALQALDATQSGNTAWIGLISVFKPASAPPPTPPLMGQIWI